MGLSTKPVLCYKFFPDLLTVDRPLVRQLLNIAKTGDKTIQQYSLHPILKEVRRILSPNMKVLLLLLLGVVGEYLFSDIV